MAEPCARLLLESGPALFSFAFGSQPTALRLLTTAFQAETSAFSHRLCQVALEHDRVLGIALAYPVRHSLNYFLAMPRVIIRALGTDLFLRTIVNGMNAGRLSSAPGPDDYFLSNLAVQPDHRGKGIGSLLLEKVCKDAVSANCPRCCLDVELDNSRAITFYQRHGFKPGRTTRSGRLAFLTGKPGHLRMAKPLF